MGSYELALFGFPRLSRDGADVAVPLRKGLALAAYLDRRARPATREALTTLLWPDLDEEAGRAALRRLLHRMRQIAPGLIEGQGDLVGLNGASSDAGRLEAAMACGDEAGLARVLDTIEGPFLDGFHVPGEAAFEDWRRDEAERLRALVAAGYARLCAAAEPARAVALARRWVRLDPLDEPAQQALIGALAAEGRHGDARRQYERYAEVLARELGETPSPGTRDLAEGPAPARAARAAAKRPETCFVETDGLHIAYQVFGSGPLTAIVLPGYISHLEVMWEYPPIAEFLAALGGRMQVVFMDRRGIGLSDRVGETPSIARTADDMAAVLDAVGVNQAVAFGMSEGGPAAALFAALKPERTKGLILYGTMAKGLRSDDHRWALSPAQYDAWLARINAEWGGPLNLELFGPSRLDDPATRAWWSKMLRQAATPGSMRRVIQALRELDVREELGKIRCPTLVLHRRGDMAVRLEAGRHLASLIPHSRFVELPGSDHFVFLGDAGEVVEEIERFVARL